MLKGEIEKNIKTWLNELCVEIGSRPAGSNGIHKAEKFISNCLKQSGYTVDVQRYECPFWELISYSLTLGMTTLECTPNTFSPSCDVSGSLVMIDSMEDLIQEHLEGKIAVLNGELTSRKFSPRNFDIIRDKQQDEIIRHLEEKRPSAIIMVSHKEENRTPLIEDSDFKIPSMTVSKNVGDYLIANKNSKVKFEISSKRLESNSSNIAARNTKSNAKRVLACAHYDTKYGTPGSLDNASGVITLLALAKMISGSDIGMEFVFFGGEELWYPGDAGYLKQNEEGLMSITSAINIDSIGLKNSSNTIAFLECPSSLRNKVLQCKENYSNILENAPWYDSNQTLFWPRGIPSMAMISQEAHQLVDNTIHTEFDTIDLLDMDKITEAVMFVYEMICEISKQ